MSRHLAICLTVAALTATWSSGAEAQAQRTARNTVYLELGGNALLGGGVLFQRFSGATSTGFGGDLEAGVFVPKGTAIVAWRIAPRAGGFVVSDDARGARPPGEQ